MKTYYNSKRAASYNRTWRVFSEKTLAATCSVIDLALLRNSAEKHSRAPRILDVACGTGLLLHHFAVHIPGAELYGVDESRDMLAQARLLLENYAGIHLSQAVLRGSDMDKLPYEPHSFDLITCTNAFHYLDDPVAVVRGLTSLLAPQGQIVIEDYARRAFPFPWRAFSWVIRRIDPQHVRAYTLTEARILCQAAGLHLVTAKEFSIDLLWQGWVILAEREKS
jgi:ubiquinone/menaquinone biosynthesis C-methylase UbiE